MRLKRQSDFTYLGKVKLAKLLKAPPPLYGIGNRLLGVGADMTSQAAKNGFSILEPAAGYTEGSRIAAFLGHHLCWNGLSLMQLLFLVSPDPVSNPFSTILLVTPIKNSLNQQF